MAAEGLTVDAGSVNAAMGVGTSVATELAGGLPEALSDANTAGVLIAGLTAGVKDNTEAMDKFTETFITGFVDRLPVLTNTAAGAFIDELAAHVAERLGIQGQRL